MRAFLIIILFFLFSFANAQTKVKGYISERDGRSIPGVGIAVLNIDSSLVKGTVSDTSGIYSLELESLKKYILRFTYLGYNKVFREIETKNAELDLGRTVMRASAKQLSEVEVVTVQTRGEQKGDTTSFHADAFKTNPDATAEDLIKKMPGVTSDNNGVKVNGEEVKKVMVDGKPFFGEDPNAAIKNLPAEIIDKVEIFDRMSDQSQFTGFNDGDQQKAINFITKKGKNVGQFGKVYGGLGSDEKGDTKYNGGAVLNSFKAKQRVSLLLMSNNINQQNFSISDITGAMGNNSGGGRGDRGGNSSRMGGGGFGGPSSGLMTAQQNGISATQSAGFNYSDEWGKKTIVSGSYFFNYSDNLNQAEQLRNYFGNDRLIYAQSNTDRTINMNHRFNFRLEYNLDSANKIIFTPNFTYQDNLLRSKLSGSNTVFDTFVLSKTETNSRTSNAGYDLSPNLLYQHRINKKGRSVSLNLNGQLTEKMNDGTYYSKSIYVDTTSGLDQKYNTYGNTKKAGITLSYTEPAGKYGQLQVSYNPSYYEGSSYKETDDYSKVLRQYKDFNTALSNSYFNVYTTQKAGLSYKYNKNKFNLTIGADGQQARLSGDQTFPVTFTVQQNFSSVLPNLQINYKMSRANNIRFNYRTSTNIPSMTQLQDVLDVSNPLQVKAGNTSLKQNYEQNFSFRFGGFDVKTSRNAMLFMNGGMTNNYISNANYTIRQDTFIQGYEVKAGTQLTRPVNLDNYYNARMFVTYGFPVKLIKSNVNVNGGINYSHTPGLNNDVMNYANNYAGNAGVFIGSNISQYLDFSLGYNANYTTVKNTVQVQSDNAYFNHGATFKLNWILFKSLVVNTDLTHTLYNGLNQNFNQEFLLWNAYLGYKFFKKKTLEAKVSVFDILKQNRSVSRTITGNYSEDNSSVVLQRYGMITLTYTFRNFKKGSPPKPDEPENPYREMFKNRGMMPPGGPPFH